MIKISKSDTTPEMEREDAEARDRLKSKKSLHFEEGTDVMLNNRRGRIIIRHGGALLVQWEDGAMSTIRPHALNRKF